MKEKEKWIAPGEGVSVEHRDPRFAARGDRAAIRAAIDRQTRLWAERQARAEAALAANGREPVVRSRYWAGGGWYVSDDPDAPTPRRVGDHDFKTWIPA